MAGQGMKGPNYSLRLHDHSNQFMGVGEGRGEDMIWTTGCHISPQNPAVVSHKSTDLTWAPTGACKRLHEKEIRRERQKKRDLSWLSVELWHLTLHILVKGTSSAKFMFLGSTTPIF